MTINEFLIEQYYAKYEFSTKYMLSSSDAETISIEELLNLDDNYESNLSNLLKLRLGYTESKGNPNLREEIAKLYRNCNKENVLVFSGAEEGIYCFVNSVINQNDHVIVMYPAYQSLYQILEDKGIHVTKWEIEEDENWNFSLDTLLEEIKPNSKCLVINTPHNPTGFHFSREVLRQIVDICRKNSLLLFSDEVYRFGEYNKEDLLPPVAELYDDGFSLGVLSKSMGLPGLRIGWIVTQNISLLNKIMKMKDYTTICSSAPSEFLSILALQNRERIVERNNHIRNVNLDILISFMKNHDNIFTFYPPMAGNIAFVKLNLDIDIVDFCNRLRDSKDVLLLPSTTYNFGNSHFRIGFGRENFPEALKLLGEFVKQYS